MVVVELSHGVEILLSLILCLCSSQPLLHNFFSESCSNSVQLCAAGNALSCVSQWPYKSPL